MRHYGIYFLIRNAVTTATLSHPFAKPQSGMKAFIREVAMLHKGIRFAT